MKKTTLYMRKRRALLDAGGGLVKKHPMALLRECRTFNPDDGTDANAVDAMNSVSSAFIRMCEGSSTEVSDFDYLAHAVGVAEIRAVEIAGHDDDQMIPILRSANAALARCKARYLKWGKLELSKVDASCVCGALDIYEAILFSSSPRQMANACEARIAICNRLGVMA